MDPYEEMKHLAEQANARQVRRLQAYRGGTIREFLKREAKDARDRYAEFASDRAADSQE